MAGVLKIVVEESAEVLKTLLDRQRNAVNRSKVQMLWWLRTGEVTSVNKLAQMSGYHRTTVFRWLSEYRQGGLEALLAVHPKPVALPKFEGRFESAWRKNFKTPKALVVTRKSSNGCKPSAE